MPLMSKESSIFYRKALLFDFAMKDYCLILKILVFLNNDKSLIMPDLRHLTMRNLCLVRKRRGQSLVHCRQSPETFKINLIVHQPDKEGHDDKVKSLVLQRWPIWERPVTEKVQHCHLHSNAVTQEILSLTSLQFNVLIFPTVSEFPWLFFYN